MSFEQDFYCPICGYTVEHGGDRPVVVNHCSSCISKRKAAGHVIRLIKWRTNS